jgi:hypothetical protein
VPQAIETFRALTGQSRKRGRRTPQKPSVPPREKWLVTLILVNVLWLAFSLGGVRLWGEIPALFLALACLFFLPTWREGEWASREKPVFTLLRLPLFWAGFGLYAYLWVQTWNLAWVWTYGPGGTPQLASQTPAVSWLPASLTAPMDESQPLRSMMFMAIPWISACCLWAGLTTRRALTWMVQALTFIGLGFAVLALWQHFEDADKVLGLFETVPSRRGSSIPFWGTLINSNHGAFFLILANGLCLGRFLSGWHRDLRLFKKGGGAWLLYLGCAMICTFAVLMAQARGAIIFLTLQWLVFFVICSIFLIRAFGKRGAIVPGALCALMILILLAFVINPDVYERQKRDWDLTFQLVENPELEARYYMAQICRDMIADAPWLGHGAGSFPYLHLPYLADYPEFRTTAVRWIRNPETGRHERRTIFVWFKNAHVDLMEYIVEWGIIGCLFPLVALIWLVQRAFVARRGWDAGGLTIFASCGVVFLGAAIEFHFRIPLVLLAWAVTLVGVVKLADLNARGRTPYYQK